MRLAVSVLCLCGFLVAASLPAAAQPRRNAVRPRASVSLPRSEVMELATRAFQCAWKRDHVRRPVLTVIDYSLPSTEPRLWVIDMAAGRVLFHELVAHGRHSGDGRATRFSNEHGSKQSSLGLFRAEETYLGQHGYSLRMSGLEPGVNDNARERAIVIHGAGYVSRSHIAAHGRLGRSWGCPALAREVSRQVIDTIKDGSVVFAYYPDDDWLRVSSFLRCDAEPL